MKKIFTSLALASLFLPAILSAQAPTPELLYYKFDGTGTTIPNQASAPPAGTGTATIVGGQTQGSSGQCGGALIGNGQTSTSNYVNTNWATNLNGTSWTLSFWTSNVPSTTSTYYILGDVNAGGFRVFTGGVAGAGNWILRGGFTDILATGAASTGPSLTTFVYDMPNNQMRAYVNGTLVSTVAQTTVTISGAGPFKVGGYSGSASLPSTSLMDEFRLYNRALTVAEIQTLMITSTTSTINPATCANSTYTAPSGTVYSSAGTYMDTIPNVNGCDSVITINLSITPSTTSAYNVSTCDRYTAPSGAVFTTSGTYTDTIQNTNGCDSIITITLNVDLSTSASISPTVCNSYAAPSGAMYFVSGAYMDTISNAIGCDSVITINLVVNNATSSTVTASACNMYTAPSGAIHIASGTFIDTIPNMSGCDSLITINLTVNQTTMSTMNASACTSYTAPSGAMYTASGTYMDTIPNMSGCDSIITINLSINQSLSSFTVAACDNYTAPSGAMYNASGTYMDTIPNMNGCDSIMTIALTISSVNANATANNTVLTASTSGASYQWMDCNTNIIIPNATNQSYTATVDGDYAVIVTQNNCTDTSACLNVTGIGMAENAFDGKLNVYPNPSKGEFFVDLGSVYTDVIIVVTDVAGRVVYSQTVNGGSVIPVELNAPAGMYIMTVTAENNKAVMKLVKE